MPAHSTTASSAKVGEETKIDSENKIEILAQMLVPNMS
jgi:hypothetical protein